MLKNTEEEGCTRSKDDLFPIDISYIPDTLRYQAKSELFEDDDTRIDRLRLLKSMLKTEETLRCQQDDPFLLAFLRTMKFDTKRAFDMVKKFYSMIAKYDELYYNFNYDLVRKTLRRTKIGFLPHRDDEGCAILVFQIATWEPHEISFGDINRALTSLFVIFIRSPATQISGFKIIVDLSGLSLKQVSSISFSSRYVFALVKAMQTWFPARFREIHVVNENYLFSPLWLIIKQFLSKKIKDRWHFHGRNVNEVHKYISPNILPAEYEGRLLPFENSSTLKEFEKHVDYLNHVFSFGYENKKIRDKDNIRRIHDRKL